MSSELVTPEWLEAHLSEPDILILDCTWFLPTTNRSGRAHFEQGHIPGAQFVDLKDVSDPTSPFENMMPDAHLFEKQIGALGGSNASQVVIYDSGYVSARLWWMFKRFGHDNVRILDGGFQRWKNENRPVETGPAVPAVARAFRARTAAMDDIVALDEVLATTRNGSAIIVDARTREIYEGTKPTGYPGIEPGHIPTSINLPWNVLLVGDGEKRFLSPEEFSALVQKAGIDLSRPIISTCGSGITACILAFQLHRIGHQNWKIYDGSWNEWGQTPGTPKQTSAGNTH